MEKLLCPLLLVALLINVNQGFGCCGRDKPAKYTPHHQPPGPKLHPVSYYRNPFRNGHFPLDGVRRYARPSLPRNGLKTLQRNIDAQSTKGQDCDLTDLHIVSLQDIIFPDHIKRIDLRSNSLSQLDNVKFPAGLTELYLTHNSFTSESTIDLSYLTELTDLSLAFNNIKSLNKIKLPQSIKQLNLAGNNIYSFDDINLAYLTELWYLDLSSNEFTELNGNIAARLPQGLTALFLDNNDIQSMQDVTIPHHLELLNLTNNALQILIPIVEIINLSEFEGKLQIELAGNYLLGIGIIGNTF